MTDEREREIVISRVIHGPRDLVFEVYTSPEHLDRWWGPEGFRTRTSAFEFRVGGAWVFTMHGPDSTDWPNYIAWREIVWGERLVFTHGERADDPEAFTSTITFTTRGADTEVTMRAVFRTKEQRDRVVEQYGAIEGGQQTLARLAQYVEAR